MNKYEDDQSQHNFFDCFLHKILIVTFLFIALTPLKAFSQSLDFLDALMRDDEVIMIKGDLQTLPVHNPTRISIVDPDIADILDVKDTEILLIAKKDGETPLFIWEEEGKRMIMLRVVLGDLEGIKQRLQRLLSTMDIPGVNAEINTTEGKIILSGYVPEARKEDFDELVKPFEDHIWNMVKKQEIQDLIQIDMQITQLDTTLAKSLGILWTTSDTPDDSTNFILNYPETLPEFDGSAGDWFKVGRFNRTSEIQFTVDALIQEGKARVLSQPKLVVVNGEQASFLVGGQVPIRTTTQSESGLQENVSFKDFGVNMQITPTIKESDKIDVQMNVEISDVSESLRAGDDVGYTTQTATTRLLLDDKQTIIIAGLIKHNQSETINRVPFVSKVPIFGLLFRHKTTPETSQELVISLTPTIVNRNRSGKVKKSKDEGQEYTTRATFNQTIRTKTGSPTVEPYYIGISKDMAGYVENVQRKISKSITYPEAGRPYGWEGTAKLNLLILRDGTLAYAVVQESSGYEALDSEALKIAKSLAPYEPFPANSEIPELNISVPIVFSLQP
jgi:pilus assembly protein CpaC